jgi:signal peptidase I
MKKELSKAWDFFWNSNSPWSWLLNIVVAFLFIKFIFYPISGMGLNTTHPIVAVVSGSMEHMQTTHDGRIIPEMCGNTYGEKKYFMSLDYYWEECGSWYEENNITKEQFSAFSFKNGFNKGDIIIIYGTNPKNLKIGDVIVYNTPYRHEPIIHRIVAIDEYDDGLSFTTKGDHNSMPDPRIDTNIKEDMIIGRAIGRIPYLGWIKVGAMKLVGIE